MKLIIFLVFLVLQCLFAQEEFIDPQSGSVTIESDIPDAEVYIRDEFKGKTPITLENLIFNLQYTFTIKKNGYRTVKKNIVTYKSRPKAKLFVIIGYSKLLLKGSPDDVTITIDKNLSYVNPNDTLKLIPGDHLAEINKKGYYESKNILKLESGLFKELEYDLKQKSGKIALPLSIVIPGAGQYYVDEDQKGFTFFGSTLFSVAMFMYFNEEMKVKNSKYTELVEKYHQSVDEEVVNKLHNQLDHTYSEIKLYRNLRNVFLVSGMAIWIYNIIDISQWNEPGKVVNKYALTFKIQESGSLLSLNYSF